VKHSNAHPAPAVIDIYSPNPLKTIDGSEKLDLPAEFEQSKLKALQTKLVKTKLWKQCPVSERA